MPRVPGRANEFGKLHRGNEQREPAARACAPMQPVSPPARGVTLLSLWPQAKNTDQTTADDHATCRHRGDGATCRHRGDGDTTPCTEWPPTGDAAAPASSPAPTAPASSNAGPASSSPPLSSPAAVAPSIAPAVTPDDACLSPLTAGQMSVEVHISRAVSGTLLQIEQQTPEQLQQLVADGEVARELLQMASLPFLHRRLALVWSVMQQQPQLFGLNAESLDIFKAEDEGQLRHLRVYLLQDVQTQDAPSHACCTTEARNGASPSPLELRYTHAAQACMPCSHKNTHN